MTVVSPPVCLHVVDWRPVQASPVSHSDCWKQTPGKKKKKVKKSKGQILVFLELVSKLNPELKVWSVGTETEPRCFYFDNTVFILFGQIELKKWPWWSLQSSGVVYQTQKLLMMMMVLYRTIWWRAGQPADQWAHSNKNGHFDFITTPYIYIYIRSSKILSSAEWATWSERNECCHLVVMLNVTTKNCSRFSSEHEDVPKISKLFTDFNLNFE